MLGRPPKYETPQALHDAVEAYFNDEDCDYTITGVALALGFESRQSFYDLEKKEDFSYIIKKARLRVENAYENNLRGKEVGGAIFALKNMGWRDKTEVDNTLKLEQINLVIPDGV